MITYVSFGFLQGLSGFIIKAMCNFNKVSLNSITVKRLEKILSYKFTSSIPLFIFRLPNWWRLIFLTNVSQGLGRRRRSVSFRPLLGRPAVGCEWSSEAGTRPQIPCSESRSESPCSPVNSRMPSAQPDSVVGRWPKTSPLLFPKSWYCLVWGLMGETLRMPEMKCMDRWDGRLRVRN